MKVGAQPRRHGSRARRGARTRADRRRRRTARVHRERAEVDAIAVGSGTVLADDPLLTARGAYRGRPLTRVIFDRRLRTPPAARRALDARRRAGHNRDRRASRRGRPTRAPTRLRRGGRRRSSVDRRRGRRSRRRADAPRRAGVSRRWSSRAARRCTRRSGTRGLVDRVQMYVTPRVARRRRAWPGWPSADRRRRRQLDDVDVDARSATTCSMEGDVHRTD